MATKRIVIGLAEDVEVYGSEGKSKKLKARVDTGATRSSIDVKTAAELNLGPIKKAVNVKQALGTSLRPVVKLDILIHGKNLSAEVTLADRSHLKYKLLLGQDVLKDNFIIDPSK